MKKVLKDLVAAVATIAMVLCAMVAQPTAVKADTTKTLYLEVEADATYSLGFWSPSGITVNADAAADGWTYVFTKASDGVYTLEISLADGWTATGLSLCVDGAENYKADPQWSGDAGAAAWTALSEALAGDEAEIHFSLDDAGASLSFGGDSSTDEPADEPSSEEPSTDAKEDDTTAATESNDDAADDSNNGNDVMVYVIIAAVVVVIIAAVVVVSKKKNN